MRLQDKFIISSPVYQEMWKSPEQLPSPCAQWHWEPNPWLQLAPAAPREKMHTGSVVAVEINLPPKCPCAGTAAGVSSQKSLTGAVEGSAISTKWRWKIKHCHGPRGKKNHTKKYTHTKKPLQNTNMLTIWYFRICIFHTLHGIIEHPKLEGTYKDHQCPPKDPHLLKDCRLQN